MKEPALLVSTPSSCSIGDVPPQDGVTVGILSTFPPTLCGLATFSSALAAGLTVGGAEVAVVRVADGPSPADDRVVGELVNGSPSSVTAAADLLSSCDVAVVQHEYGLYGGADGDEVLHILAGLRVPSIVVAHTVLSEPSRHQRTVLTDVAALSDRVVVMSDAARLRLCNRYDVDPAKVVTIPHGATLPSAHPGARRADRPIILTSGLIGPGKGIERMVDAMADLHALPERPRYLVAGRTHPKVVAAHGEAYRNARIQQAWRNGVAAAVIFDADYRDVPSLVALLQSAAVVVLPYDSTDQATSGVLVDAVAAGRPVVATAFPHAVELLGSGAGIVVDHDDPSALVSAVRRVLTEPALAAAMAAEATRLAAGLGWPTVARCYRDLADRLTTERAALV